MTFARLKRLAFVAGSIALTPSLAFSAETATASLTGTDGKTVGTAQITEAPRGVVLHIEVSGLTPGWHGMHFHEKGNCSAPAFTSAGSHVHTTKPVTHGLLNAGENDSGDLPNIFAGSDGTAKAEVYSTFVSLKGNDGRPALLDADGSSLVIHASADDYQSQPIGGSGLRVICGVVR
ncbi:superoxide dismutase[Cu-Zn] [Gluconobacter cerinus]|uniref:Superoxide dismutase [Cu-Zn] n=3 Tax=Gluconobacter cerinus TaxID=38307 RepID=A0AAV5N8F3_9PROT|nr:superoxide dismutase family protein [Gluconobacter cerinus]GLQ61156.1 superoxide dismutase [Cu-Zn] [Gluconobacter cerinus]